MFSCILISLVVNCTLEKVKSNMTNTETVNELEEFKKYQKASRAFVKNSKIRGDDFSSVLTGLYNNPSHFIYEILQNAEDAGAKEIGFELFEDRLDIYHNGKDFNLEDIKGVTRIGNSKKRYDLTVIGKFGVGFKSVFAITETPHIFSGKYNVKIEDLFVPLEISCNDQIDGTLIRLTFNHRVHSKKEVFTLIANRLLNIDLKTMLFLNNIENIKFRTPLSNGNYSKSSEDLPINVNTRKVIIKSQDAIEEYIVVDKPIFIEGKQLKVEIAYKLENDKKGKKSIVEESNSKLVVFFPTEKITFLNFIIQGPYRTTVTREDIPLENEQNMLIIEETGNLVSESLAVVKD